MSSVPSVCPQHSSSAASCPKSSSSGPLPATGFGAVAHSADHLAALQSSAGGSQQSLRHAGFIPANGRGNSEDGLRWLNPSATELHKACERKHKAIDARDCDAVAMIHGRVLEETWAAVMEYESMHYSKCKHPKLDRFEGMSTKPSPKAKLLHRLGSALPFDRHNWFVDRCGTEVRYVIDYHSGFDDRTPFIVDARPDLYRLSNAIDRLRLAWRKRQLRRERRKAQTHKTE